MRWAKKIRAINLLGGQCDSCKTKDIFVLQFHHINTKNKKDTISNLIHKNLPWNTIKQEVLKCKLLCENCHTKLHHPSPKNIKNKIILLKFNGSTKCKSCGNDNILCLDFHHNGGKTTTICNITNNYLRNNAPNTKKILKKYSSEIKNCTVLCSNCHAKQTVNSKKFNILKPLIETKVRLMEQKQIIRK
jgi:hypothetical protein